MSHVGARLREDVVSLPVHNWYLLFIFTKNKIRLFA